MTPTRTFKMKMLWRSLIAGSGLVVLVAVLAAGCGHKATSGTDGGTDGGPQPGCFNGVPTTNLQLINACTNAQFVDKHPTLPNAYTDGGLPPIQ